MLPNKLGSGWQVSNTLSGTYLYVIETELEGAIDVHRGTITVL